MSATPVRLPRIAALSWDDCRLLVESVVDYAIFMLDTEGHVATWNLGAERIKGYQAAEIVGQHFSRFYPQADIDAQKPQRELAIATDLGRVEDEGWRLRKDGTTFWANVVITALRDESGQLRGFAKVTRDLTQRRAAEDQLRQSEQRFHSMVDAVADYAIFMLDPEGRVATWNVGARRIKGYESGEIVGRSFTDFYTLEQRAEGLPQHILDTARREGRVEHEGWRVRKDGTRFWANVVITALRDARGELIGFAKVTRDLTDRRRVEDELRRSEERFRLLVDGVTDYAIYMLDPAGRVTTWNAGAERMKGYRADEIIGRSFAEFFPQDDVTAGKPARELEVARTQGRFEDEGWRVRKDGTRFWANVVVTSLRSSSGELLGFAKVTRDLTVRRAAEETARSLIREQTARAVAEESERHLRESEERYRALSRRLEVIFEGVADGITVQDREGTLLFANSAAARICGFASVEELLQAQSPDVAARLDIRDEQGRPYAHDDLPDRRVFRGEAAPGALLRVRNHATGDEGWTYVRAGAVMGTDGRPELAVNIWHDVTLERRSEEHAKYLADATAALAASLDYHEMLATLAGVVVPSLADWCTVHLLEGDELQAAATVHADPARSQLADDLTRRFPPDRAAARGVASVVRGGVSEVYNDVSDELLAQLARSPEHLAGLRALGLKALLVVPVRVRDRITGAISLASGDAARRYAAHDVALLEELGRRAGITLENGRLYAAERRARDQLALLAHAGEVFSATSDHEEMLRRVIEITMPALADVAFFDVVEGGEVRRLAAAHDEPQLDALVRATRWTRAEAGGRSGKLSALTSGESGYHPDVDDAWLQDAAAGPEQLDLLRRVQVRSLITVPLRARAEVLGALTLCFGKSGRRHGPDDLRLAEELARRAALALAQARLYEQAHQAARTAAEAARRAEEAGRVKDEFLATVSHELRTPLNAILGWAALLRERGSSAPLAKGLDVIHRNAQAQSRLVEDILDVSRIITGKLRLDLKPTNLAAVIAEAIEVVRPSAAAKHIAIDVADNDAAVLLGDPERLRQVVWNLLSNAVKFTESGGRILVDLEQDGSRLTLTVRDTGRGIEREFLPFVFDRFKQADSSTTRRFGGLGLGLAIVRHIVELHGGQVRAESEGLGKGATMRVLLPVRAVVEEPEVERPASVEVEPPARPAQPSLRGLRVLVVDDDDDARELLHSVLLATGAEVRTAPSAREGLAELTRFHPHVLVSDIGMPDEDGYAFVKRVRALPAAEGGRVPSIALTAYTRAEDRTKALAAGFTTHVGKPVNPHDLVAAVANLAAFARAD